jgi:hypothetical protein
MIRRYSRGLFQQDRPRADIPTAPITLMFEVVSFEKRHHCTGHRRDQLLIASVYCERLCLTDRNSSTRLHHFAPKNKTLTFRRRKQVRLKFYSEYGRIIRHKRERCVSARIVEHGCYDTGMHETRMLCVRWNVGHHQFDFSGLQTYNFDTEGFHHLLLGKALLDPCTELRVFWLE